MDPVAGSGSPGLEHERQKGPPRRRCLECSRETFEHKPYCKHHVHLMPYVAELLVELERRWAEDEAAAEGRPSLKAASCRELIERVREHGRAPVLRLSREMGLAHAVALAYLRCAAEAGLVRVRKASGKRWEAVACHACRTDRVTPE